MKPSIFNVQNKADTKAPWFTVRNADDGAAEIRIYSDIGTSWWEEESADAQWIADQLKAIPKNQKINLRINSRGGNVWDGLVMYNLLKERREYVTTYIDGIAASIASIVALAGNKVIIPKNGTIMIHDPSCYCEGTEKDMLAAIALLQSTKESLVSVYKEETNLSDAEIRSMMEQTTWMTGQQALDNGFVTDLVSEVQIAACGDLSIFRNAPKSAPTTTTIDEMKPKNLLLDPAAGVTAGGGGAAAQPSNQTPAAPAQSDAGAAATITQLQTQVAAVTAQLGRERKSSIEKVIDGLVSEGRIAAGTRDFWVTAAIGNEAVVEQLRQNAIIQPPSDNLRPMAECTNASPREFENEMNRLRAPMAAFVRGNDVGVGERLRSATAAAQFHQANRGRLLEVINANTIGSGLKRQVLLQESIRPFARRIMPLKAFCSVFAGVSLQGTNVIEVPYFPLVTTASTDWNQTNGYVMGDSTQNTKNVTVNKRKYQPILFNSDELARQPALNLLKVAEAKAEKLAADVFADVLSVVTNANFGAAAYTGAANTFDLDIVGTLKGVADGQGVDWPTVGRSLMVGSAYDINLLKQSGVRGALNFGSSDPVQKGDIKEVLGFDYYMLNYIPGNAENLTGFIAFMSAILFAGSPIGPKEEVRSQLTAYEVVTDPQTGATFEYRRWGSADKDERREIIECNYGYNAGEPTALKRIVSA